MEHWLVYCHYYWSFLRSVSLSLHCWRTYYSVPLEMVHFVISFSYPLLRLSREKAQAQNKKLYLWKKYKKVKGERVDQLNYANRVNVFSWANCFTPKLGQRSCSLHYNVSSWFNFMRKKYEIKQIKGPICSMRFKNTSGTSTTQKKRKQLLISHTIFSSSSFYKTTELHAHSEH